MIGYLVATGAVYKAVAEAFLGGRPNWKSSLAFAARRAHSLLWVSVLGGLIVGIGFVLCFIPGIYLAVAFAVAIPAVMTEDSAAAGARPLTPPGQGPLVADSRACSCSERSSPSSCSTAAAAGVGVISERRPAHRRRRHRQRTHQHRAVRAHDSVCRRVRDGPLLRPPRSARGVRPAAARARSRGRRSAPGAPAPPREWTPFWRAGGNAAAARRELVPPRPSLAAVATAAGAADTPAQVRALAAQAEHDPAPSPLSPGHGRRRAAVDFRALLNMSGAALQGRLARSRAGPALRHHPTRTPAPGTSSPNGGSPGSSVPRPFHGVLGWLGGSSRSSAASSHRLGGARPGRRRGVWAILSLLVVAIAAAVATRIAPRREGRLLVAGPARAPPASPRIPPPSSASAPRPRSAATSSKRCGCASARG